MTKTMTQGLSRRAVLRGMGTAIALPWLEAMLPRAASAASAAKPPLRLGFLFAPNGFYMPDFKVTPGPQGVVLGPTLASLEKVKQHLLFFHGLTLDKARANGDGGGDHARSAATYLTGMQARKTAGADIRVGVSVDQLAAAVVGKHTRLPSLEIGCDRGAQAGSCDSGYSCAYSSSVSWRGPSTPMGKEVNPRAVFERLFEDDAQTRAVRDRAKANWQAQSVLDLVREDADGLRADLGTTDRHKLDEYLDAVRSVEKRVQDAQREAPQAFKPPIPKPQGIPSDHLAHIRLLGDLMILAWQADVTRVSTFMFANEGSDRSYPAVGVKDGHHYLSHHEGRQEKIEKIKKIDRFHVEQFAYLVERLAATPEGSGSLLDNVMLQFGSGIADGNHHSHHDLPIVLAGRAGGAVKTGRVLKYPRETPLCNLYVAMLHHMGVRADAFGDSNGKVQDLA